MNEVGTLLGATLGVLGFGIVLVIVIAAIIGIM